jgi:hypothetical protein
MRLAFRVGLVALASALAFAIPSVVAWTRGSNPPSPAILEPLRVDFGVETPSADARRMGEWIAARRDNRNTPFAIIDKKNARLYVFDHKARLIGSSPVLLGSAIGDFSAPGVGLRETEEVPAEERTTPAGRFVATRGRNLRGEQVLWINYEERLSMHPVLTANRHERRIERLETPTVADNRISNGCVNVPADFYNTLVQPTFYAAGGVIYILPESETLEQVFRLPPVTLA